MFSSEYLKMMAEIHTDLGEVDYDKLEAGNDPISQFRREISCISFDKNNIESYISKLSDFGSHIDKSFKEKKYVVVLSTHLMSIERMKDFNVMEPREYIKPSSYDVLLTDVKHNDLIGPIAERLGVEYLSQMGGDYKEGQSNVRGILYGTYYRPMVNLVVASKKFKKFINIIFLVDTGSPCLYICEKAMEKLGFTDHVPETFDLLFDSKTHEAVMSPSFMEIDGKREKGHYHDLNLIGASFLSKERARVAIDYAENTVTLSFK
eukprot:NODE_87_length_21935_cov_0.397142.p7 type:complete len:263 gc:universal NODE_87_length_21935_cov_0.397142:16837-17625(+)